MRLRHTLEYHSVSYMLPTGIHVGKAVKHCPQAFPIEKATQKAKRNDRESIVVLIKCP